MSKFIFTSESVTKGHPDKVSDIISDSILDAYLKEEPTSRAAAETVVKNNTVVLIGKVSDEILEKAVTELIDLRPGAIIQKFNLRRPIYAKTAAYGHFGRDDIDFTWEKTNLVQAFKRKVQEITK